MIRWSWVFRSGGCNRFQSATSLVRCEDLFAASGLVHPFWESQLRRVNRTSAINMVGKLVGDNPLAFPGAVDISSRKSSTVPRVVDQACAWKKMHPEYVLLVRLGDFFEAWGLDAVMLVQHAGLNPMGDSCRAGCPKGNLQQTINSLVEAGLSVAVYEEVNVAGSRSTKIRKERYLSQICTPGRPLYIHDTCLKEGDLGYLQSRPYGAIRCGTGKSDGCSLYLINVDAKEIREMHNLTEEALGAIVDGAGGLAEPVWIAVDAGNKSRLGKIESSLPGTKKRFPVSLSPTAFRTSVLNDMCQLLAIENNSFSIIDGFGTLTSDVSLRPLHSSAAQFLGVSSKSSPDLVKHMIPADSPHWAQYFLRNWLLCPPPLHIVECMQELVKIIAAENVNCYPQYKPIPVDKVVRLLETRNGNAAFFEDLHLLCDTVVKSPEAVTQSPALFAIAQYASGISQIKSATELITLAGRIMREIEGVILLGSEGAYSQWNTPSDPSIEQLEKFFQYHEASLFEKINMDFASLNFSGARLTDAVRRSLIDPHRSLRFDPVSDVLYVKDAAKEIVQTGAVKRKLVARNTGSARNASRESVDLIIKMEAEYRDAVQVATDTVRQLLQNLSTTLSGSPFKKSIVLCSHWSVVMGSVLLHAETAARKGWTMPLMSAGTNEQEQTTADLAGFWPFWMEPLPLGTAALNNWSTDSGDKSSSLTILTAPNMSGKSTLIRSVGACMLLGSLGFMVPAKQVALGRFHNLLVVSPNGDRPAEGISAFAAEADAMSAALKEILSNHSAGNASRSLLLVDEFGRGTSGVDATALSAAVLAWIGRNNKVSCLWATHLHELYSLDCLTHCRWMQMDGFKLTHGKCVDSLGVSIARDRGVPEDIVNHALKIKQDLGVNNLPIYKSTNQVHDVADLGLKTVASACPVKKIHNQLFPDGTTTLVEVPNGFTPPPIVQAKPVVYVLRFDNKYYIGETEDFKSRIRAHARRFQRNPDSVWFIPQENRSRARAIETSLIQEYMRQGINLLSTVDGAHSHSLAAN